PTPACPASSPMAVTRASAQPAASSPPVASKPPESPTARRPGRSAPASYWCCRLARVRVDSGSVSPVRPAKAGKDLRALLLNCGQLVRAEPQEGEDRRRDLSRLDRPGLDLRRDARAADHHQDVTVARVHATVLGQLGRSRVDDALL